MKLVCPRWRRLAAISITVTLAAAGCSGNRHVPTVKALAVFGGAGRQWAFVDQLSPGQPFELGLPVALAPPFDRAIVKGFRLLRGPPAATDF